MHSVCSSALPLSQRLGQLCVVGFEGTTSSDPGVRRLRELAEAGDIGGAIFFGHNVDFPEELRQLVGDMRTWRSPCPLWLMVDQEGGRVQRLRPERGFAGWASAGQAGALSTAEARSIFEGLAGEVADCGFNVNLAPVVDLHFDDSPAIGRLGRSYGAHVSLVTKRAREVVEAHRRRGIATALKHFPGHGSAYGDTHHGFTDVSGRHTSQELEPFAQLIASGHADMVMTSHLVHRPLAGGDMPVTLSRRAVFDTLRQDMGFQGVIVSDDLCMGALSDVAGGMPDIVTGALASGHDLLVVSGNRAARGRGEGAVLATETADDIGSLSRYVADGLRRGRLEPGELERSCRRIASLKARVAG